MYHLLVNVPSTLPSSLMATDWQSFVAISAATFLAGKMNEKNHNSMFKFTLNKQEIFY